MLTLATQFQQCAVMANLHPTSICGSCSLLRKYNFARKAQWQSNTISNGNIEMWPVLVIPARTTTKLIEKSLLFIYKHLCTTVH